MPLKQANNVNIILKIIIIDIVFITILLLLLLRGHLLTRNCMLCLISC